MPLPSRAKAAPLARSERWILDWIGVWAMMLGVLAAGLATFIYVTDGNTVAASFVFIAFAAIIGIVLRESTQTRAQG